MLGNGEDTMTKFSQIIGTVHPFVVYRDWSSENVISSIEIGAPRHSPVNFGVATGENRGTHSPGSEFWKGRPPINRDLKISSENSEIIIFLNIFKIK